MLQHLDSMVNSVTGDVLLSAAYIAYLGPFTVSGSTLLSLHDCVAQLSSCADDIILVCPVKICFYGVLLHFLILLLKDYKPAFQSAER